MTKKQTRILLVIVLFIWIGVMVLAIQTAQIRERDTYVIDPNEPTPACMGLNCSDPSLAPIGTEEPFNPDLFGPAPSE